MILYGRDLSPFARRIAIFGALQGHKIERRDLQTAGADFDKLRQLNPVARVPVLELDDGTRLIDAFAIGDWLDETAPNGVRMLPANGVARRDALQRLMLAAGVADKAVALVYDRNRRPEQYHWMEWQQRLVSQIKGGLAAMDAGAAESWPDAPDAGTVADVIAYQFVEVTNPWVLDDSYPRLAALAESAMAHPAIASTKPTM